MNQFCGAALILIGVALMFTGIGIPLGAICGIQGLRMMNQK